MDEKKDPKFWKGDPYGGFATGLILGIIIGIINILFLHWWHIGLIVFLTIWLFQGTQSNFKEKAEKREKENDKYKEAEEFVQSLPDNTKTVGGVPINVEVEVKQKEKRVRKPFGSLVCPHCKSANIQTLSNTANIKKIKRSTSISLNPFHPLTAYNHNEKVVKKRIGRNKSHQYQCRNCGKVWKAK